MLKFLFNGYSRLEQMSREYGIAQAMVEYAFMNFGEEDVPVPDHPGRGVQLKVEVGAIAVNEASHLQESLGPEVGVFRADVSNRVGEGDAVREAQPADILADGPIAGGTVTRVEMEGVSRQRLQ